MRTFRKKIRIWLLIVAILVGMLNVSAYATSFNYVVDNAEILSDYQVDTIQKELEELEDIKLAIVINDAGKKTTNAYAYNVAKDMYKEVFADISTTGIVIAYCSSLEGFKIGVYSEGKYDIDENKIKSNIENSFHLYKTDSLWVEGSIISCVDYLKEVETKNHEKQNQSSIDATANQDQTASRGTVSRILEYIGAYHVISSIIGIIFFAGIAVGVIFLWKYLQRRKRDDDDWE